MLWWWLTAERVSCRHRNREHRYWAPPSSPPPPCMEKWTTIAATLVRTTVRGILQIRRWRISWRVFFSICVFQSNFYGKSKDGIYIYISLHIVAEFMQSYGSKKIGRFAQFCIRKKNIFFAHLRIGFREYLFILFIIFWNIL